jgi:hypothetical protein
MTSLVDEYAIADERAQPPPLPTPTLTIVGVGDFLATTYPEPVAYIEGILSDDGGGWIGGEEKTFKTWWMLDEASSLGLGVPVAGHFPVPQARRVTIFEEEDSPRRTQRRLRALLRGKGFDPDDAALRATLNAHLRICVWSGFTLDDPTMLVTLRAHLVDFKPEVVYLDCLRKLTLRDLNKAPEAGVLLAMLDGLRREFGVIFRVIHHYRKAQGFRAGRGSQEIGGSYALGAWGENSLFFEPVGRKHGVVTIAVQSKDGAPLPGFRLRLETEGPAHNPDVVRLTVEEEATATESAVDDLVRQAVATLEPWPALVGRPGVPLSALIEATKKSEKSVRRALDRLIDAEVCLVTGTLPKKRKLYGMRTE